MIPTEFLEDLRRRADIVRYISDHLPLTKAGASWKGLCPFHDDKNPSLGVRAEPPLFHCFGCGSAGDVFRFAMLLHRVPFPEAVRMIANHFGIDRPATGNGTGEEQEGLAALAAAAEHFSATLWARRSEGVRQYFFSRGFTRETLEHVGAGAAANSWTDLLKALRHRFSPQTLVAVGLVERRGELLFDRFRNRVMLPIQREDGRIVAFAGRAIDGGRPKYVNSTESTLYKKSEILYGLPWAKEAIQRSGRAVVVEGYLDVAHAYQTGIKETVAICGTAVSLGMTSLIRRITRRVVLSFDGDEAGERAVERSLEILLRFGLDVRVAQLPSGQDPDSLMAKGGRDAFRTVLAEASPWLDALVLRAMARQDLRTAEGRAAVVDAVLPTLVRLPDPVRRAAGLAVLVERAGLRTGT